LLARLRQRANAMTGASVAGLAQRLIDEGLRMADHPGVIFKDGPSGRRAALAYGPDVYRSGEIPGIKVSQLSRRS